MEHRDEVLADHDAALALLAKVKIRSGADSMKAAKDKIRASREIVAAEPGPTTTPEPEPEPTPEPPAGALFHETFDKSPAPSNYGDTPIWVNDGEAVPVSGGVAHADTNKVRLWTRESFPGSVEVEARVKPTRWRTGDERFAASWAGWKFYLRRQPSTQPPDTEYSYFYTAEPMIYDGSIRIQKKFARDTYVTLGEKKGLGLPLGDPHDFKAIIRGMDPVIIEVWRDGQLLLMGKDDGSRGGRMFAEGPAGWRSDALAYDIDDFTVAALG